MTTGKFSGEENIRVLQFLFSFKHACDDCGVNEPNSLRVLKNFLVGGLQAIFLSYLGAGIEGSQRGVDCESYAEAIYWFLLNYGTESVLSDAFRSFRKMRQNAGESEEDFGRRVREEARLCIGVFDEPAIIAQFVDGVHSPVRFQLQERLNQNPTLSFQALTTAAQNYGDAIRGGRDASKAAR